MPVRYSLRRTRGGSVLDLRATATTVELFHQGRRVASHIFDPVGWLGRAYWYALVPVHQRVFRGMLRAITRAAVEGDDWP